MLHPEVNPDLTQRVDADQTHPAGISMTNSLNNVMAEQGLFTSPRWLYLTVMIGLLILGLGLRLADLDDPPLDYHPTRQLRSAIIARAIYYHIDPDRDPEEVAAAQEVTAPLETLEPPIIETLVAWTYLLAGGEYLWIPRLYVITFWMIGGLALFDLARRMSGGDGAFVALAYYMVLPFAVVTSRAFQPDSAMVMFIILSAWAFNRWKEKPTWQWALAAGLLSGLGVLVKAPALFPIVPMAILVVLSTLGFQRSLRSLQVWTMFALILALPVIYYLVSTGSSSSGYFQFWNLSFSHLLLQPRFYVLWLKFLDNLMYLVVILAGAVGILFFPSISQRLLVLGWWIGYLLYGLFFPFQINTHEYYSLMFVPAVALALSPLAGHILSRTTLQPGIWKLFLLISLLLSLAYPAWIAYSGLKGVDSRPDAIAWQRIGKALPTDGNIVALTEDYGTRVLYYGMRLVEIWPLSLDLAMQEQRDPDFQNEFIDLYAQKTTGKDYFLVTAFSELENHPKLKQRLYEGYQVLSEGDGYILFDLRNPLDR
jgi:hypothetical protein